MNFRKRSDTMLSLGLKFNGQQYIYGTIKISHRDIEEDSMSDDKFNSLIKSTISHKRYLDAGGK